MRTAFLLMAALPFFAFSHGDFATVEFSLGFYESSQKCEITSNDVDHFAEGIDLTKTSSGTPFYHSDGFMHLTKDYGNEFTTDCFDFITDDMFDGKVLMCAPSTSILSRRNLGNFAAMVNYEVCDISATHEGFKILYLLFADSKNAAQEVPFSATCRFRCLLTVPAS